MSSLKNHLQDLVDIAEWSWLKQLAQQGKLVMVTANLELVDVGLALAEDDSAVVKQWLDDGWIYRPSADQIDFWDQQEDQKFSSLIIQPFVLSKELPKEVTSNLP